MSQCVKTMGWLRLVGSLKLWVSVAKEPYKRDSILQKRPIILRSLLIVATPYVTVCHDYVTSSGVTVCHNLIICWHNVTRLCVTHWHIVNIITYWFCDMATQTMSHKPCQYVTATHIVHMHMTRLDVTYWQVVSTHWHTVCDMATQTMSHKPCQYVTPTQVAWGIVVCAYIYIYIYIYLYIFIYIHIYRVWFPIRRNLS